MGEGISQNPKVEFINPVPNLEYNPFNVPEVSDRGEVLDRYQSLAERRGIKPVQVGTWLRADGIEFASGKFTGRVPT